jgi:hypothetical protein
LEISKNDDYYLYNLGILNCLTGDNSSGLKYINKAIDIEPNIAVYHIVKGLILEKVQDSLNSVFNEYSTALVLSPEITDSYFYKELIHRFPQESKKIIDMAIDGLSKQISNPIIMAKLGKLYLSNNDTANAYKLIVKVTQQMPNLNRPWLYLGIRSKEKKDTSNMKLYYARSAYLDYDDFLPKFSLAEYYNSINQQQTAILYYRETLINWLNTQSFHSNTSEPVYLTKSIPNDLFPSCILYYVKPIIDFDAIQVKINNLDLNDDQKKDFKGLFKLIDEKIGFLKSFSNINK